MTLTSTSSRASTSSPDGARQHHNSLRSRTAGPRRAAHHPGATEMSHAGTHRLRVERVAGLQTECTRRRLVEHDILRPVLPPLRSRRLPQQVAALGAPDVIRLRAWSRPFRPTCTGRGPTASR
jgi:hypothetical protein